MYEAIVFDMDGVLVRRHADYPDVYRQAVREAFEAFDVDPDASDVDEFYAGANKTHERMTAACERHDLDLATFWPERERCTSILQQRMFERGTRAAFDDCEVLTELAREHRLAIVSNNQQATVDAVLEQFDVCDAFDVAYGREPSLEGYERTKPEPYYVERALSELGTRDALFVGDGEADVLAARETGLDCAFLTRGDDDVDGLAAEPTYVIDGLDELLSVVGSE